MWIVCLAVRRPYTFIVRAMRIAIGWVLTIARMRIDLFPEIDIPVIPVIWRFAGFSPNEVEGRMVTISERAMTTQGSARDARALRPSAVELPDHAAA